MNREDIIRMAREAEIYRPYWDDNEDPNKDSPRWVTVGPIPPLLERFAALVVAAEREKFTVHAAALVHDARHDATEREREACAKVCEDEAKKWDDKGVDFMALLCAAAIRARGEK